MENAVIGLGSNVGNRASYLEQARILISQQAGPILKTSSIIETESWGFKSSPFLNQIVIIGTVLPPLTLLDQLQAIERRLGRTEKSTRQGGIPIYHARTIDLDLLDYNGLHWHDERLTLPHPEIRNREFILQSLRELNINIT